ncbi:MAG: hypothetical protein AAGU11_15625 [Syntrophobacteraceae bacterium]
MQAQLPETPLQPRLVDGKDDLELECIRDAGKLETILLEEARALQSFDGAGLLKLMPTKALCASELSRSLDLLLESRGTELNISRPLRDLLERIRTLNDSNRYFIENSLSHWRDILSLFHPAAYGPTATGSNCTPSPKGLAFSREV